MANVAEVIYGEGKEETAVVVEGRYIGNGSVSASELVPGAFVVCLEK